KCTAGTYKPLTEEAVTKLHAGKQVTAVKQLAQHGGGRIDPDTVVSPDSFTVGPAAAGARAAARAALLPGKDPPPPRPVRRRRGTTPRRWGAWASACSTTSPWPPTTPRPPTS